MRKTRSELRVKKVRNLTGETMWAYTELGELIEIPPEPIMDGVMDGNLPLPEPGVYYIIDEATKACLEQDWHYNGRTASSICVGRGKENHMIYHFRDNYHNELVLA